MYMEVAFLMFFSICRVLVDPHRVGEGYFKQVIVFASDLLDNICKIGFDRVVELGKIDDMRFGKY